MAKRQLDPKRVSKQIGLKIRSLRLERGWTLEECEEHGWKEWTHLQRIEGGKNITVETLINICNLFGVRPAVLFEDI